MVFCSSGQNIVAGFGLPSSFLSLTLVGGAVAADWPEQLLTHEKAGVVYSSNADSSRPGQLLFRGLRVRVAISTGEALMDLRAPTSWRALVPAVAYGWGAQQYTPEVHQGGNASRCNVLVHVSLCAGKGIFCSRTVNKAYTVVFLLPLCLCAGIPSLVYSHELTNTLMYAGPVMDLVTALSDLPAGGQVKEGSTMAEHVHYYVKRHGFNSQSSESMSVQFALWLQLDMYPRLGHCICRRSRSARAY